MAQNVSTWVVLVDPNDRTIGVSEKLMAHRYGLRHRAFSVFLLSEAHGERLVLLQQRAGHKYHCPSYWSNACCSHPLPDEEVSHAATRRLQEELGLDVPLAYAGVFTYRAEVGEDCIEHEIDHVFYGYLDADAPIYFNQSEVASMQWWPIAKLDQLPSPITPWFASAWALVEKAL